MSRSVFAWYEANIEAIAVNSNFVRIAAIHVSEIGC